MSAVRGMDNERAIAEKLGVRLLLAGSVLQADNRIVLSVRLTDPHTGRVIWGSQLERLPSNILGARFKIANLVAARLSVELPQSRAADSHELKAEAQEAFIRGLVEVSTVSNARMLEGVRLFETAVTLEPRWAEPLAYLAYAQRSHFGVRRSGVARRTCGGGESKRTPRNSIGSQCADELHGAGGRAGLSRLGY